MKTNEQTASGDARPDVACSARLGRADAVVAAATDAYRRWREENPSDRERWDGIAFHAFIAGYTSALNNLDRRRAVAYPPQALRNGVAR